MVQEVVWAAGASEGQCFFFSGVWKMSMDNLERWTGFNIRRLVGSCVQFYSVPRKG